MESIHLQRGFSLVELLVVVGIIGVVSSIIFTSQSSFNKTTVLSNTAYDVALTIKDAETYGLGTRVAGTATNAGYGINFQKNTSGLFTLFIDSYPLSGSASSCHPVADSAKPNALPGDCVYEVSYGSSQSEKISDYTLGNGITISDICAYYSGSWKCSSSGSGSVSSLDIVFARPNPDPFMSVNGSYSSIFPVTTACIVLTSPNGGSRYVSVGSSGSVSANASSCP